VEVRERKRWKGACPSNGDVTAHSSASMQPCPGCRRVELALALTRVVPQVPPVPKAGHAEQGAQRHSPQHADYRAGQGNGLHSVQLCRRAHEQQGGAATQQKSVSLLARTASRKDESTRLAHIVLHLTPHLTSQESSCWSAALLTGAGARHARNLRPVGVARRPRGAGETCGSEHARPGHTRVGARARVSALHRFALHHAIGYHAHQHPRLRFPAAGRGAAGACLGHPSPAPAPLSD
jgi:hypothetical protein